MRQTIETCLEFGVDLYILFIDFKQAFDSVDRDRLMVALEDFGGPKKLVRLVHVTLMNSSSRVLVEGRVKPSTGRHRDALPDRLFTLALYEAVGKIDLKGNIIYKSRQAHPYTDDIALVAGNQTALGEMFQNIIPIRTSNSTSDKRRKN